MWTEITRVQYRRDDLAYASDTREREWAQIAPLLPSPHRRGRPCSWHLREIFDAIFYILWTGCQWRALPVEFPPRSTVQRYFYRWREAGLLDRLHAVLVARARRRLGRNPTPSAGIIDSQSVPTTEAGGPRGIDAGKRIKGRKRHIVTDTQGFLLAVRVHEANLQDPHGAVPLLRDLRRRFPELGHIFADRVYRGPQLQNAVADCGPWTIEIASGPPVSKASSCCPGVGWSNAVSPGSVAAGALPRTSRRPSRAAPPGSTSPISASSPAAWRDQPIEKNSPQK